MKKIFYKQRLDSYPQYFSNVIMADLMWDGSPSFELSVGDVLFSPIEVHLIKEKSLLYTWHIPSQNLMTALEPIGGIQSGLVCKRKFVLKNG